MKFIENINTITELAELNLNVQGYYWMSNARKPEVFSSVDLNSIINSDDFKSGKIPFVIEARWYDENKRTSVHIDFVDGEYKVFVYDLDTHDLKAENQKQYEAHDLGDFNVILISDTWMEEEDPYCNTFPVLVPGPSVFSGLKK